MVEVLVCTASRMVVQRRGRHDSYVDLEAAAFSLASKMGGMREAFGLK